MATNGSNSGVVSVIDTATATAAAEEFNPLEMLMQAAANPQDAGPPEPPSPEPEVDYNKPLTDGAAGYAVYSTPEAAMAALGLGNGGEADQWAQKLTANQRQGVKMYTDGYYHEMNDWMRMLPGKKITDSTKAKIPSLQHALDKYELKQPLVTHRGMGPDVLGLKAGASTKQILNRVKKMIGMGRSFTDFGFSSAGAASNKAWPKEVVVHTMTPAGKGIGAFVAGQSSYHSENEFLYNSGTKFKPVGVYTVGSTVHINAVYDGRDKSTNGGKHVTETPF